MVHSSSIYVQCWPIVVLQHIAFVVLVLPQSSNLKNMPSSDDLLKENVVTLLDLQTFVVTYQSISPYVQWSIHNNPFDKFTTSWCC